MKCISLALGSFALVALGLSTANAALDDASADALMKKSGCSTCHALDKKLVGPNFKDVAARRKAAPGAAALLAKKVRSGSQREYGPIPMPPNPEARISDADLHDLVAWILSK